MGKHQIVAMDSIYFPGEFSITPIGPIPIPPFLNNLEHSIIFFHARRSRFEILLHLSIAFLTPVDGFCFLCFILFNNGFYFIHGIFETFFSKNKTWEEGALGVPTVCRITLPRTVFFTTPWNPYNTPLYNTLFDTLQHPKSLQHPPLQHHPLYNTPKLYNPLEPLQHPW